MLIYFLVALGSAVGGVARYGLTKVVGRIAGKDFPWGTLLVNISGCFLIGLFGVVALIPDETLYRQFFTFGVLGGYTTFSSFSLEALYLAQQNECTRAALYVAGSVAICIAAAACGVGVGLAVAA